MSDKKQKQQAQANNPVADIFAVSEAEKKMAENVMNAGPDEGYSEKGKWGDTIIVSKVTRPDVGVIKAKFRENDVLAVEEHLTDDTAYYVRFGGGHYVIVSKQAYELAEKALTDAEVPF